MANTRHLAGEHRRDLAPGDEGYDPLDDLWGRLARPFDAPSTVAALVGLSAKEVARKVGIAVAMSSEAERLLDEFPHTVRSLATSMKTQAERCTGELRGPVLWSETMSARASTFGANDVFVCATPSRAYDIDENQVLRWALSKLSEAASDALDGVSSSSDDLELRKVRRNGNDAARFADHPSMARVSLKRPNLRTLKRTRSGKKSKAYMPAIEFLERILEPIGVPFVATLCDERTTRQHEVLMRVAHLLEERSGNQLPDFQIEQGALYSGPVQYHNRHRLSEQRTLTGVVVGPLLIDVPSAEDDAHPDGAEAALAERAGNRQSMVVRTDADIDAAVERAVELARS